VSKRGVFAKGGGGGGKMVSWGTLLAGGMEEGDGNLDSGDGNKGMGRGGYPKKLTPSDRAKVFKRPERGQRGTEAGKRTAGRKDGLSKLGIDRGGRRKWA